MPRCVRVEQALRRQIAARGQQPVRLAQRGRPAERDRRTRATGSRHVQSRVHRSKSDRRSICARFAHAAFAQCQSTRFAPSPTGYLHLGHVVNAIYVWGMARALGGRVLLRMEDHDRDPLRPNMKRASSKTWRGLALCLTRAATARCDRAIATRLRSALEDCREHASRLRVRLLARTSAASAYDGHCRDEGCDGSTRRRSVASGWIQAWNGSRSAPRAIEQTPAEQCGDLLLRDRDGHWTYQFAVTVDDMAQGITHVIRGRRPARLDERQLRLRQMLGRLDRRDSYIIRSSSNQAERS